MTKPKDLRDQPHNQSEDPAETPERPAARPEIEEEGSAGGAQQGRDPKRATSPKSAPAAGHDIPVEG